MIHLNSRLYNKPYQLTLVIFRRCSLRKIEQLLTLFGYAVTAGPAKDNMFKTGPLVQLQLEPSDIVPQAGKRQTCRGTVAIAADIRAAGGQKNRVHVVDISQTGFRMECLTHIADNQVIYLTIPNFEQMEARIAWQTEWMYGCQFARPLYLAVYDHIVRTHPALAVEPKSGPAAMIYGADASRQWARRYG